MRVEVDQSGKIEKTNKLTVVAFSDGKSRSVLVLARDKQRLQKIFRKAGKPRMFVIQTFACLIYFLLRDDLEKISQIVIDKEYSGYESLIKSYVLQVIRQDLREFSPDKITFAKIGRKSPAHLKAYQAYRRKRADRKIRAEEVLKLVSKLD